MNRDFLKEAIADAKTVKESAIANAKVALEEAFSPKIHAMFAQRIEEMENEENEKEIEETKMSDEEMSEYLHDEDDTELDEILAELEKETSDDVYEEKDEINEAEEEEDSEVSEEEIDLENMSEEDLKSFIEDVIEDMVKAGELEAGDAVEDEEDVDGEDEEMEFEIEDDEEMEFEIEDDEEMEIEETKYIQEVKKVKTELSEAVKTIAILKSELNEINLLNAKLLFANKIFKAKNLNESQKVKVLNTFDKAETVKEVKIVFETLNESFKTVKKPISESIIGSASRATLTPKVNKEPIVESNEMVERFKKLAGII
jgi:hypothetical protein